LPVTAFLISCFIVTSCGDGGVRGGRGVRDDRI
jgi:hypothetical protein